MLEIYIYIYIYAGITEGLSGLLQFCNSSNSFSAALTILHELQMSGC